ncbi:transcriptional regulator, effector-binding domain/component [Saccharomonospora marina XMU15]|uniref:Transcriptional regulator, effector-binding domain/component n=1 Tax=Saccharomonospora marina XMU15 TaxID=882083 RepID=H5X8T0_9PSEU|nr:GyrI-like domain-containing protein [Saccharomonospora marina]EHR52505.1 transcriptional regulator, effector-binding domain/component [Saccharomonospora marina XMU15]
MRTYSISSETLPEQPTLVARATLFVDEIGPWLGQAYQRIAEVIAGSDSYPIGPPFARYRMLDDDRFDIEAGFPIPAPVEGRGDVHASALPGGPAAITVHVGGYDEMEPAYEALASWVADHGGELAGDAWENYLTNPEEEPDPGSWRTEIVQPYRVG